MIQSPPSPVTEPPIVVARRLPPVSVTSSSLVCLASRVFGNPIEAETVRAIFTRYLELGSVHALRDWLAVEGIRPKPSGRGRQCGSSEFGRGALFHLLKNRVYLGEITHRGSSHPGRHPAILDAGLFEAAWVAERSRLRRTTSEQPER
jgi:site-specific DNA recombinase